MHFVPVTAGSHPEGRRISLFRYFALLVIGFIKKVTKVTYSVNSEQLSVLKLEYFKKVTTKRSQERSVCKSDRF